MLISLSAPQALAGLGTIDDSDILQFTPLSIGTVTSGSFALLLDGSDVGLTTNGEDIDAVSEMPDGSLIISTLGNSNVTQGVSATDMDLLLFNPASLGPTTSGNWSLYFQGSTAGLTKKSEGIRGAVLTANNALYLTTQGAFRVNDISGNASDIFLCHLTGTGANKTCSPASILEWRGALHGLGSKAIDGLSISRTD